MKLTFEKGNLLFKHPFKIAHGTRTGTAVVFTKLNYEEFTGYGEASLPPYLEENQESVFEFLKKAADVLSKWITIPSVENIMHVVNDLEKGNYAAKASIDIAVHDLVGKMEAQPCWKLFGLDSSATPVSSITIGMDSSTDVLDNKLKAALDFPFLKVKLNGKNDKKIISEIRERSDKKIAVDINQGWANKEEALRMIEWLHGKGVIFVEQPLLKKDLKGMKWLYERSPLPLFADEDLQTLSDLESVSECFHGINIKLMKCGGMLEARKIIDVARSLNMKVMIGCMSESSCAVSAAAQLSPLFDYADLDGPLLITNDPFRGIEFSKGKIILSEHPGIGAIPKEKKKTP